MDWLEILNQLFEVCVVPLLGVLTAYLVALIKSKMDIAKKGAKSEMAVKYLELLEHTVTNCVVATNQTYVNALKGENAFDAEAQKKAFSLTYDAVVANLTDEAKSYLGEVSNDIPGLITNLIEAKVAETK